MTEPVAVVTKSIDDMTKDELYEHGLLHGVELDRAKKRADMIEELKKHLPEGDDLESAPESPEPPKGNPKQFPNKAKYLKHPVTGMVFPATELLLKRGDMLPCNEDGKPC